MLIYLYVHVIFQCGALALYVGLILREENQPDENFKMSKFYWYVTATGPFVLHVSLLLVFYCISFCKMRKESDSIYKKVHNTCGDIVYYAVFNTLFTFVVGSIVIWCKVEIVFINTATAIASSIFGLITLLFIGKLCCKHYSCANCCMNVMKLVGALIILPSMAACATISCY